MLEATKKAIAVLFLKKKTPTRPSAHSLYAFIAYRRQVHFCTFKHGNEPLLSDVSIPMNNQPQLHRTAAPDKSTERTKGTTEQRWKHT